MVKYHVHFKQVEQIINLQAYDGSNVLNTQTIIATTNFNKQSINFIIPTWIYLSKNN